MDIDMQLQSCSDYNKLLQEPVDSNMMSWWSHMKAPTVSQTQDQSVSFLSFTILSKKLLST